jgi:hypothetical protein
MNSNPGSQLKLMLPLLEQNPSAFDAGEVSLCRELIERLASIGPRSVELEQLRGLLAFAQGRLSN